MFRGSFPSSTQPIQATFSRHNGVSGTRCGRQAAPSMSRPWHRTWKLGSPFLDSLPKDPEDSRVPQPGGVSHELLEQPKPFLAVECCIPLPDFEAFQVLDSVVVLNFEHPAFGQSISSAHSKQPYYTRKKHRSTLHGVTKGCADVQFCVAAAKNLIRFRTSKFKSVISKNLAKSVLSTSC